MSLLMEQIAAVTNNAPPLCIRLGQKMARTPLDSADWMFLNRLYGALLLAEQVLCQRELRECNAARRGQRPAEIVERAS